MDDIAPPPANRKPLGFMLSSQSNTRPSLDPYAFPSEDSFSVSRSFNSLDGKVLPLSLHPRTVLPPGNPSHHASVDCEGANEFFQHPFSNPLYSPAQGSQSSLHSQFSHPSSKVDNKSSSVAVEQVHAFTQSYSQSLVSRANLSQNQNIGSISHTIAVPAKSKKKNKAKKNVEQDKKIALEQINLESSSLSSVQYSDSHHSFTSENPVSVDNKTDSNLVVVPTRPNAGNSAPLIPSSIDSGVSFQPSASIHFNQSTSHISATNNATTFTNSLRTFSEERRQSTDSVELLTSRPASRTSTLSSSSVSSEGKVKEASETVPLSKILEIIEREKQLGSSGPCKRRRTAKPQHIQVAEEEAKKYAAANTSQGTVNDAVPTETLQPNQHNLKKGQKTDSNQGVRSVSSGSSQEKVETNSRTSSQVSSPALSGLDVSQHSNSSFFDVSEKAQSQFSEHSGDGKVSDSMISEHDGTGHLSGPDKSYMNPNIKHDVSEFNKDLPCNMYSSMSTGSQVAHFNSQTHKTNLHPSTYPHKPNLQLSTNAASEQPATVSSSLTSSSAIKNTHPEQGHIQSTNFNHSSNAHVAHISSELAKSSDIYLKQMQEKTELSQSHQSRDPTYGCVASKQTISTDLFAPNHTQYSQKTVFAEKTFTDLTVSNFTTTQTLEHKNNSSNPQSNTQTFFHQLSMPSSQQRLTKQNGAMESNTESVLPAIDTLKYIRAQELKPSLTPSFHDMDVNSDMYDTQSLTADIISRNDLLPAQQLSGSNISVSVNKARKKRTSPHKPKTSLSSDISMCNNTLSSQIIPFSSLKSGKEYVPNELTSQSLHSDNSVPAGTLPPFGAFAGKKTDVMYSSLGHLGDSVSQHVNSVGWKTDTMPLTNQQNENNVLNQRLHTEAQIKDTGLKEVDKPNMPLTTISSTRPFVSPNCDVPTGKQVVYARHRLPNNVCFRNMTPQFNKSNPAWTDMHTTTPQSKEVLNSGWGFNEVSHERTVSDDVLINMKREITSNNPLNDVPPTADQRAKTSVNPCFGNSEVPPLSSPVMTNNTNVQDRTFTNVQDRTLPRNYLTDEMIANTRQAMLNKAPNNISTVMYDGDHGHTVSPVAHNITGAVVALPGKRTLQAAVPVTVSVLKTCISSSTQSSQQLSNDNTINRPVFPLSTVNAKLATSAENKEYSPLMKSSVAVNGWDRKLCVESQTLKKEKEEGEACSPFTKHIGNGLLADSLGNNCVKNVTSFKNSAKKRKPSGGAPLNGSLPDFSKTAHIGRPTAKISPSSGIKMDPSFIHMTPEEELDHRLRNNCVESVPQCSCLGPNYEFNESVEGPYYSQLGVAKDMQSLRRMIEERTGHSGKAVRLEKVHYTGKEGRSKEGCPIAKWIIRRSGPDEKYLCVARKRPGHFCDATYIVMVIVAWEGVASSQADSLYGYLISSLTKYGFETDRRCGTNDSKTCACQGVDLIRRGASFSFGCSWSMYFNGCKFARSHIARKFKLKDTNEEKVIEEHLQDLATKVAPLYKTVAPDAYRNQTHFEDQASMCRLGKEKGRPFSGVTACVDFCAHSHKDFHNMQNGSTVVVTLTKHRDLSKPDDEQLHVLPLYVLDNTDEHGSVDGQMEKVQAGSLEILHKYSQQVRLRDTPLRKPRRGAKKNSPAKGSPGANTSPGKNKKYTPGTPSRSRTPSVERDTSFLHSQDSSQSLSDGSFSGNNSLAMQSPDKPGSGPPSYVDRENSTSSDDLISKRFGPSEVYEKVWEYFYTHGVFPPPSYMERWAAAQKQVMMNSRPAASNMGAYDNGSNVNTPHQSPSHQPFHQAADFQQNHFSPGTQSPFSSACKPFVSGHELEAAHRSEVDPEIVHLTQTGVGGSDVKPIVGGHPGSRHTSPFNMMTEPSKDRGRAGSMLSPSSPSFPGHLPASPHSRPPSRSSIPPSSPGEGFHHPDYAHQPRPHSTPNVHNNHPGSPFMSPSPNCDGNLEPPSCNDNQLRSSTQSKTVMQSSGSFVTPTLGQGPDEPTFTMMDPTVVRCHWKDNEESFHDPGIGGVAIALSHGAVLFEVAKRELHATTGLKNPNRYQPTRISLVFYQHKNLNHFHHGYYEYERKLATQRESRIKKLMEEGVSAEEAEKTVKPGRKRKKKEEEAEEQEEKVDFAKTSAAQYKYMWDTTVRHGVSLTTDSIITRWIDPQPMVTGPYQRWV